MKFVASSSSLLKQLTGISGVITSNPIVPILENFLFEVNDGRLKVTASDLQTSMITDMYVEAKETGSVAIPAKILIDTLKNLPEQHVTFSIDENTNVVELISENGRYKLSGENATDFPKVPEITNGDTIDISSNVLNRAISSTIFATGTDELRASMTGIFLDINKEHSTFVATDGHRLVRFKRKDIYSENEHTLLIPRKALNLLKSSLPIDNTNVKMDFSTSNAFFSYGDFKMICRLIDERYPDYENVIPKDNNNVLEINRHELLRSLKRISIYANKTTNQVRLKISGDELVISAEDLDFSNEANEKLNCEYNGDSIEIGFNARFLIEILNNNDCETIKIEMSDPKRAGLVVPKDGDNNEDILMLLMPVMLQD